MSDSVTQIRLLVVLISLFTTVCGMDPACSQEPSTHTHSKIIANSQVAAAAAGALSEEPKTPKKSAIIAVATLDAMTPVKVTATGTASTVEQQESVESILPQRPLSDISIASASAATSVSGEEFRIPENLAAAHYAAMNKINDSATLREVRHPNRNLYPICHNPLYFEDPNMERCGQGFGVLTEVVSAVRFFGRVPLVPYMMGADLPCSHVRALPDCPTCQSFGHEVYVPDPSLRAVAAEEFAVLGLIFLIP